MFEIIFIGAGGLAGVGVYYIDKWMTRPLTPREEKIEKELDEVFDV